MNAPQPAPSEAEIRQWLINQLVQHSQLDPAAIGLDEPLVSLGVNSMEFVVMVGELEEWLGCRFADNPLIDYPSINALAGFLADQVAKGKRVIDPTNP